MSRELLGKKNLELETLNSLCRQGEETRQHYDHQTMRKQLNGHDDIAHLQYEIRFRAKCIHVQSTFWDPDIWIVGKLLMPCTWNAGIEMAARYMMLNISSCRLQDLAGRRKYRDAVLSILCGCAQLRLGFIHTSSELAAFLGVKSGRSYPSSSASASLLHDQGS